MQIYAPIGREVGNPQKQEAAHQRPRIPAWALRISGGQQGRKGLLWFNDRALLTGGPLGPESTGSQNGELRSPQHKGDREGPKEELCNSLCCLVSVHSEGKVVYTYLIKPEY